MTTAKAKFKCPDCDKEFNTPGALGPHRNKAHGYRKDGSIGKPAKGRIAASMKNAGNYPCVHCDFVAKWNGGLKKHVRSKHPQVAPPPKASAAPKHTSGTYQCPECARSFSTFTGLGIHRRTAHGVVGSSKSALSVRKNQRSEIVTTTQDVTARAATNGHIQVPTPTEHDHRLEATATFAAGRVAQLLESLALQFDVSFRTLAPLVLRTVGETAKVR